MGVRCESDILTVSAENCERLRCVSEMVCGVAAPAVNQWAPISRLTG